MPYVVKSKGRLIELRDGRNQGDPMYLLKPGVPHLFANMPCGYVIPGDGQVDVREANGNENITNSEPINKPKVAAVEAPEAHAAPVSEPDHETRQIVEKHGWKKKARG